MLHDAAVAILIRRLVYSAWFQGVVRAAAKSRGRSTAGLPRGGGWRECSVSLLGWDFSLCNYFFSLINLLVVCAILYILNYNASPQSIL